VAMAVATVVVVAAAVVGVAMVVVVVAAPAPAAVVVVVVVVVVVSSYMHSDVFVTAEILCGRIRGLNVNGRGAMREDDLNVSNSCITLSSWCYHR